MVLAKEVQVHRMRKYLGAYLVALHGDVDAIVFTGGIGERSHLLRTLVCKGLWKFGFEIDEKRNQDAPEGGRAGVFSKNTLCSKVQCQLHVSHSNEVVES